MQSNFANLQVNLFFPMINRDAGMPTSPGRLLVGQLNSNT